VTNFQTNREGTVSASASSTRWWSIVLGILLIVGGVLSIAVPAFAGLAASVFFGWLVMLAGAAHLVYAWSERGAGTAIWQVLIGIIYLAAGGYMLYMPAAGVVALTAVLAVYIALEGVMELALFGVVRKLPGSVWFLVDGIVSLLLAGLIFWGWPASSFWVVGTLVGISLVFSGVARLMIPMRVREVAGVV
jgi:uncharacterized membrane protein HdeD (DUF308 family)